MAEDALVIGGRRRGVVAYVGLCLVALVMVLMNFALWGFAGQGPWPVPIVWAIGGLIALRLLATRELRLAPDGITVTRHLFRWHWSRRHGLGRLTAVRTRCELVRQRFVHPDGTPEGDLPLLMFTVTLRGRPALTLGFSRSVEEMEALARRAAAVLGLPMERQGYQRRKRDRMPVRERGVWPMPP
ncbi:MAG: hypothetical protein K2X74_16540 [Acetobacteraceae bacterium]|nr:hypothetical protein [Acetobacteraceae bacterium]